MQRNKIRIKSIRAFQTRGQMLPPNASLLLRAERSIRFKEIDLARVDIACHDGIFYRAVYRRTTDDCPIQYIGRSRTKSTSLKSLCVQSRCDDR